MTLKIPISPGAKAHLRTTAARLGLTPERYVKELLDDHLALEQEAQATTFDELMGPVREEFRKSGMTEAQLDELVDRARTRHHQRTQGRKKRRRRAGRKR
jgi:hypothetical protein